MPTIPTATAFLRPVRNSASNPCTWGDSLVAPGIILPNMRSIVFGLLIVFSITASAATAPGSLDTIAGRAEAARAQGHIPDAIRLYRDGTHLRPTWSDGWWYLGTLLYDQDRFSEAETAFRRLLASTTHSGPAFAFLGLCEYETGKYDDALVQFHSWAAAGWAGTPELRDVAVYHFALLLTREGQFVDSLYLLATLARRIDHTPELAEAMGLASLRLKDLPENYPSELRERVWLSGDAALYAATSPTYFERADELAARLESRYPVQPEIHYFLGTLYKIEGKKTDAEGEYREELKLSPNHAPALAALAAMDLDKGDLAEAGIMARQAVGADPSLAESHHLLGRVLFGTGDMKESAKELEIARQLAPDSAGVRAHLAMVYNRLGRTQEAKAESAAFIVLKNKEDVMASAKEKLGESKREKTR